MMHLSLNLTTTTQDIKRFTLRIFYLFLENGLGKDRGLKQEDNSFLPLPKRKMIVAQIKILVIESDI